MFYGAPVTQPMEVPPEVTRTPWSPKEPELKEMPGILDAGLSGIRLQHTEVKALPGMPTVDIGTGARAREAAIEARDLGLATQRFKQTENYNKRVAKYKGQAQEKASKTFSQSAVNSGSRRSKFNMAKERASAWQSAPRNAYQYLAPIR